MPGLFRALNRPEIFDWYDLVLAPGMIHRGWRFEI
jgi:hypothetical protein